MLFFRAKKDGTRVQLEWRTASELNNAGFEIQRSRDGRQWEIIDFVKGYGTTLEEKAYQYFDYRPFTDINYYRLKQIDFDGAYEYSPMVSVHFAPDPKKPTLFPNPADDVLSFQLSEILKSTEVFIQIQDVNGRILMETKINYPSETGIDISGLQSGLYFIQVDEKFLDRFVKK